MKMSEEVKKVSEELEELRKLVASLQAHDTTSSSIEAPVASSSTVINSITAVEKFSFDNADWSRWISHYERYRTVSQLDKSSDKMQITNLLYQMGPEVGQLLEKLKLTEDSLETYENTKKIFNTYFAGKKNIIYERAKFNLRKQQDGEAAQEFIDSLYNLSKSCEYGTLVDQLIRDRIVVGIRDHKLSEQLQLDENLTLEKAIDKVLQAERIKEQNRDLREKISNSLKIDKVIRKQYSYGKRKEKVSENEWRRKSERNSQCMRCGNRPCHSLRDCPAVKEKCLRCRLKGHYSKMCKTNIVNIIDKKSSKSSSDSESSYYNSDSSSSENLLEIKNISRVSEPWVVDLKFINGEKNDTISFKVDSGADETVITTKTFKMLNQSCNLELKPTSTRLVGPGANKNAELRVKGVVKVPVLWKGHKKVIKMFVVKTKENLLGRPALEALKILEWHNVEQLSSVKSTLDPSETAITKEEMKQRFPSLFEGLGQVKDFEYKIKLKKNVEPVSIHTPRRVPLPLLETVRKELQDMVKKGVIEEINEATEFCSPMVVVRKGEGNKIRICTDFTELNKYIIREKYLLPTVEETISNLQGAKYFSKLDCAKGFWQLKLHVKSRPLTTFLTPFGRFMYNKLPFGICSGPEVFQKVMKNIFVKEGIINEAIVHADDILIKGLTIQEHNINLLKVLSVLSKYGLTLNFEKCQTGLTEIKYLGIFVGQQGIKPDQSSVEAMVKYPAPKNKSEVRKFLGLFTYFSRFIFDASTKSRILRELLHEKNEFTWNENHQRCFEKLKQEIVTTPVLATYQTNRLTRISADSSSYGIGGVMEQLQEDNTWRPVCFCSKTLSDAERRYAQIEKECLSLTWLSERLQQFLIGQKYIMRTDHKPLLRILTDKPIDQLTIRLQRFRMRLMRFSFKMEYVPGKEFYCPDALSRSPLSSGKNDQDVIKSGNINCAINSVANRVGITNLSMEEIVVAQESDLILAKIRSYVSNGWPVKQNCPVECLPYYRFQKEIGIQDKVLTYNDRVIIPKEWRKQCLQDIHSGHFGLIRCKQRAKNSVWWPSINNHLEEKIKTCEKCLKNTKPAVEPMHSLEIPLLPWNTVGADLMELNGKVFLVVQDYYSRWPEVFELKNMKPNTVIECLKTTFAQFGIPRIVRSDNARQFDNYEFRNFAKEYKFKWSTSSPKYPQSNGQAESAVKMIKGIMKKSEDPFLGLLAYRNTPLSCGVSPAQLMMGRQLRENLPIHDRNLKPILLDQDKIKKHMQREKENQERDYNRRHRVKVLSDLEEGKRVWIVNEKREGMVLTKRTEPRSYNVITDQGTILRRNRVHLQPLPEVNAEEQEHNESDEISLDWENNRYNSKAVGKDDIERPRRERRPPVKMKDYEL